MKHRTAPTLLSILLALITAPAIADAAPRLASVHLVSRLVDQDTATVGPKLTTEERKAVLSVVLEVRDGEETHTYGEAGKVVLHGSRKATTTTPWPPELGPVSVRWQRVEPDTLGQSFDNTSPGFHFDEIPYAETPVLLGLDQWSILADPRPTRLPATEEWVGTMRYKVVVTALGATLATPGAESRTEGGASEAVQRVTYLGARDDGYVDTLLGFFNQPYIWGSTGPSDRRHQTELFIGADCADLLTGAYRLWSGRDVPYSYSGAFLPGGAYSGKHGRVVAKAYSRDDDGVFRNGAGAGLTVGAGGTIQVGDVIVMPRHVGVLSEDRAPKGVLDSNDLVIHTLFAEPREEPLLRRYSEVKAVFRWKAPER